MSGIVNVCGIVTACGLVTACGIVTTLTNVKGEGRRGIELWNKQWRLMFF